MKHFVKVKRKDPLCDHDVKGSTRDNGERVFGHGSSEFQDYHGLRCEVLLQTCLRLLLTEG